MEKDNENKFLNSGKIYVISSSHNDIAYLDSPLVTIRFRNDIIISKSIEMMEKDANFINSIECTLFIKDFLILHPEMYERLLAVMQSGQFHVGATYTQLYETSVTSEGLVRQYYLGKRWLEKKFPGVVTRSTWNEDVPARAMQAAQVMKKCGVDYLFVSRMDAGFFRWYSPDGSYVEGFSSGHYHHNSLTQLLDIHYNVYDEQAHSGASQIETALHISDSARQTVFHYLERTAETYFNPREIPFFFVFLAGRDYDIPLNLDTFFCDLKHDTVHAFPPFKYASAETVMDEANTILVRDDQWNTYHGERPNLWVYHEPTHAEAFRYNRNGLRKLTAAEILSSMGMALLADGARRYEKTEIDDCWAKLLYLDHGWGGCNGHITDETYLQSSKKGYKKACSLIERKAQELSAAITTEEGGDYLTVFNTTQWYRKSEVHVVLDWEQLRTVSIRIVGPDGVAVPYQVVGEPAPYTLEILCMVEVPAYGYTRYRILPSEAISQTSDVHVEETKDFILLENQFYSMRIAHGGITKLYDKSCDQNLLAGQPGLGAFEVVELNSYGNGSGEFSTVQQPDFPYGIDVSKYGFSTGYTECASNYGMHWHIPAHEGVLQANGEVATIIEGEARFPHFVLLEKITLYNTIKKIDVSVEIEAWDGTMYKELRIFLPLTEGFHNICYEVPMGILHVYKDEVAGPIGTKLFADDTHTYYPTDCRQIHPREVQSWIAAESTTAAVMLSCIDTPTFDFVKCPEGIILQPILLASRHSSFPKGNPYPQRGTHSFHFTLTSNNLPLSNSLHMIEQEAFPLIPSVAYHVPRIADGLPLQASVFSEDENVRISCIKKAEDSDELVVRVYEPFGKKQSFSFACCKPIQYVRKSDMLEYGGKEMPCSTLSDTIDPYAIETYCIGMA
ncbi:MAG: glycosyl hydrolase-related protein [Spirochaetia bacterium]|jgi:alpha-mannosidase|nr:glycosyl hydrolase-related protein [Spirochaetia bacterium]